MLRQIGFLLFVVLISCHTAKKQALSPVTLQLTDAEKQNALELIGTNDCIACHTIDRKIIGPAFSDVSKKYDATPANINMLVKKIINGGSGAWDDIPMTPHKNLKPEEARKIVTYFLSLKNQQK